ncbi:hypothetical protein QMK19_29270 [Streptomyces sp. H10-C2]|uniref:hypothetical protein n=1 Tax=Streptomyces TaxID=1883 RepID=UPI0018E03E52|nr:MULTISPECIES: hypothetical protein [Streptomyces]MDJ0344211.1 hypothetical protein [Streptomyces sp. PH10-H1]MDJ0373641.1 hypothetical protein [Streptomyces sp. H10-C2]
MIILDHTAVLALARGHRRLSGIAAGPDAEGRPRAYVPALCLIAAGVEEPGPQFTAHVGALPGLDFLPLDFPAAVAVEQITADGIAWQHAHAVHAASASPHTPGSSAILTATPHAYGTTGLRIVDIGAGRDDH